MTKAEFKKLVENGPVILDGATGTNLQKAGMPVGVCPEQWILENPDIMIKLQEDYVAAGTDILYAPTFTANRIKLEEYGLADRLEELPEQIKLLHAIIWLSLTTYAWQDYDSICGAFYNGLYYMEEAL